MSRRELLGEDHAGAQDLEVGHVEVLKLDHERVAKLTPPVFWKLAAKLPA